VSSPKQDIFVDFTAGECSQKRNEVSTVESNDTKST